jgi:hypothetical protein
MVFSVRALDLVDRADLQMVLQVLAHAGQVVAHGNALALQQRARPYARQLQDLRRVDGARAQQHLLACLHIDHLRAGPHLGAAAAQPTTGQWLEQQPADLGMRPQLEIGAAIAGGPQKGLGRVPAQPALLVDLEIAHALVAAAVEVLGGGNAGLLGGLGKGVQDVPAQALALHAPFAAAARALAAVQRAELRIGIAAGIQPPVALVLAEGRQHLVPAPGVVARELGPAVVVAGLAAHVDHAVDAGAAAQGLAARIAQAPAVEALVRLGLVQPVGARVADAVQVAHGNVDPVVVVLGAGLDQQHAVAAVARKPVGQEGAGRAGADDDVVERGVAHGMGGACAAGRKAPWSRGGASVHCADRMPAVERESALDSFFGSVACNSNSGFTGFLIKIAGVGQCCRAHGVDGQPAVRAARLSCGLAGMLRCTCPRGPACPLCNPRTSCTCLP